MVIPPVPPIQAGDKFVSNNMIFLPPGIQKQSTSGEADFLIGKAISQHQRVLQAKCEGAAAALGITLRPWYCSHTSFMSLLGPDGNFFFCLFKEEEDEEEEEGKSSVNCQLNMYIGVWMIWMIVLNKVKLQSDKIFFFFFLTPCILKKKKTTKNKIHTFRREVCVRRLCETLPVFSRLN